MQSSCSNCQAFELRNNQLQQDILDLEDRRSRERVRNLNHEQHQFFRVIDNKTDGNESACKQDFLDLLGLLTKLVDDNPGLRGLDELRAGLDKFKV